MSLLSNEILMVTIRRTICTCSHYSSEIQASIYMVSQTSWLEKTARDAIVCHLLAILSLCSYPSLSVNYSIAKAAPGTRVLSIAFASRKLWSLLHHCSWLPSIMALRTCHREVYAPASQHHSLVTYKLWRGIRSIACEENG